VGLNILACQLNPVVGDIAGNLEGLQKALEAGRRAGSHLVVTPELSVCGYPPEDLILKPSFLEHCEAAVAELGRQTATGDTAIVVGTPWRQDGVVYNAAILLCGGEIVQVYHKRELPNYGVFDEKRLFAPGDGAPCTFEIEGVRVALAICEDIWFRRVPEAASRAGAQLLIVPNASPWRRTIQAERMQAFAQWSETQLPYLFVNQIGGQDELVFDGASFSVDAQGHRTQWLSDFETGMVIGEFNPEDGTFAIQAPAQLTTGLEAEYRAAMTGLRDYVDKNRFPGVVLGLSGGIDSALTAAMACDALGPDRVWCLMMPSRYTSRDSLEDAKACADALGVRYDTVEIAAGVEAFDAMLAELFAGRKPDVTEENIQSRLRGSLLMAVSNKFGHMVVTTGNKSEMAVGYATLYGDMNGGFNPLKDFYKTEVFDLSRWRNTHMPKGGLGASGVVIPQRIITKPPSAELRADQRDDDSLPRYEVLDDILRRLVDGDADVDEVIAKGHDPATVRRIEHLVYIAEYKRRQAPPGVKIGPRNFGRDRRYPITNRWRDD
jgi:NAD+ synthase